MSEVSDTRDLSPWRKLTAMMARLVDRLYGHDVFVAHRRVDGAGYAEALVERLDRERLASFIDKREYGPGDELSHATLRNIRKSTMLVIVGSPAIQENRDPDWLLREINTYLAEHAESARRILPISFGDSLLAPPGRSAIVDRLRDTLRLDQPLEGLRLPPSEAVIAAITQQFRKRTRDSLRLFAFQAAASVMIMLTAAAVASAWFANLNATHANAELRRALASRLVAEGQAGVGSRSGEDEERLIQQLLAADSIAPGAVSQGGLLSAVIGRSSLHKIIPVRVGAEGPLTFAAGGQRLLLLDSGKLRVWNAESGQEIAHVDDAQQVTIGSYAVSPDQTQVVTSGGSVIQRRDALSGAPSGEPMVDATGEAGRLAYALDGRRILSVSKKSILTLWEAKTGVLVRTLPPAHSANSKILSLRVSRDGSAAASAGDDHLICFWNLELEKLVAKIRLPSLLRSSEIRAFALSPLGSHVAGAVDDKVWLWDVRTAKVKVLNLTFVGQQFVQSVAFSPDGSLLAAAASDGRIITWDSASGTQIGSPIFAHGGFGAITVLFSPDGKRIYSSGTDGPLRVWDTNARAPAGPALEGHRDAVRRLALDPTGRRIASLSDDATLRIWTVEPGSVARRLDGHTDRVTSFALSHDGTRLLSTGKDGQVLLWDTSEAKLISKLAQTGRQGTHVVAMAPSADRGAHGTNADPKRALLIWDLASHAEIAAFSQDDLGRVSTLAFSHGGRVLAVGNHRGLLALVDASDGRLLLPPFVAHERQVSALAFGPDDKTLVSASEDGTLRIWNVPTGKLRCDAPMRHEKRIVSLAISPDGRRIVSGGDDKIPRVWDLRTGTLLGQLDGHRGAVDSIEFSPDGSRLVTASNAGTLHLWDARSNVPVGLELDSHIREILTVSFSADSRYIASGSADGTVRLWDAQTGRLVGAPLLGHRADVTKVTFSDDAAMLVSAGSYGALYLWPGPRAWRGQLCRKIVRNMSQSEWPARVSTQFPYACPCPDLPVATSSATADAQCTPESSSSARR